MTKKSTTIQIAVDLVFHGGTIYNDIEEGATTLVHISYLASSEQKAGTFD